MSEFVPIYGLEGRYSISRDGRLYSHAKDRVMKGSIAGHGYRYLVARLPDGCVRGVYVHRAVAEAFVPNPMGLPQVNHIDGDKNNNDASNLEWVTPGANNRHAWESGLCWHRGQKSWWSKLTRDNVVEIKSRIAAGDSDRDIAADYPCEHDNIRAIRLGKTWRHV